MHKKKVEKTQNRRTGVQLLEVRGVFGGLGGGGAECRPGGADGVNEHIHPSPDNTW